MGLEIATRGEGTLRAGGGKRSKFNTDRLRVLPIGGESCGAGKLRLNYQSAVVYCFDEHYRAAHIEGTGRRAHY